MRVKVFEVLKSVFKTIFVVTAKDKNEFARESIARTATFMIVFLFVHMAGNLLFFVGRDEFNAYGEFLTNGPVKQIILTTEYYLLAAAVLHACVGAYATIKYKKLAPSKTAPIYMCGSPSLCRGCM